MCLDRLMTPEEQAEYGGVTEGWKVLTRREGTLATATRMVPISTGEWLTNESHGSIGWPWDDAPTYQAGYHIYLTEDAALECVYHPEDRVYKVRFRDPTAWGMSEVYGSLQSVVVAQELYIEPVENSPNGKKGG